MKSVNVLLVGGGIVSATLASLIQRVEPSWSIEICERLDRTAAEATEGWHNSGTGHAALCELNYTPANDAGEINIAKAVAIHQQFLATCQYWAALVAEGALGEPSTFINSTPHMAFVQGDADVEFLRNRHRAMGQHHFFAGIEFSTDPATIKQWAPLLIEGRTTEQPIAATYAPEGTDVDFGSVTRQLFDDVMARGANLQLSTEVTDLTRQDDGKWLVTIKHLNTGEEETIQADTVLIGAGGWSLKLLRKAGAPEVAGYGLLPISGKFLSTNEPGIVAEHKVKVYGQAADGAPPMSVPHLDARIIDGQGSVLFGPFAGAIPRFLKNSTNWDFVKGLHRDTIKPMATMGAANLNLLGFLLKDLAANKADKMAQLREFVPLAYDDEWSDAVAGQRAQIVKPAADGKGVLQFGTEVVTSAEGTLAGVLGASPGASTAVTIALDVLAKCFPDRYPAWQQGPLQNYIPSLIVDLANDAEATAQAKAEIRQKLGL